jgi:acyl-CoA thioesterase YciA
VAQETLTQRLVLPADSNHHGTLYAGALLRLALEAAYTTGCEALGSDANLLLRRVLNLECYKPVPVGTIVKLRGRVLLSTRGYVVVGLIGEPLPGQSTPWMDGLIGFAQVDHEGRPSALPRQPSPAKATAAWQSLLERLEKLRKIRGKSQVDDTAKGE